MLELVLYYASNISMHVCDSLFYVSISHIAPDAICTDPIAWPPGPDRGTDEVLGPVPVHRWVIGSVFN